MRSICTDNILLPFLTSLVGCIVWLIKNSLTKEGEIKRRLNEIEHYQKEYQDSLHSIDLGLEKLQSQSSIQSQVLAQIAKTLDKTLTKVDHL